MDLIDFRASPDGEFCFLLNYQDHGIKLYENRPLTLVPVLFYRKWAVLTPLVCLPLGLPSHPRATGAIL